jgi:hypothetical protein
MRRGGFCAIGTPHVPRLRCVEHLQAASVRMHATIGGADGVCFSCRIKCGISLRGSTSRSWRTDPSSRNARAAPNSRSAAAPLAPRVKAPQIEVPVHLRPRPHSAPSTTSGIWSFLRSSGHTTSWSLPARRQPKQPRGDAPGRAALRSRRLPSGAAAFCPLLGTPADRANAARSLWFARDDTQPSRPGVPAWCGRLPRGRPQNAAQHA